MIKPECLIDRWTLPGAEPPPASGPMITILLSTYNGALFLRAQLESVRAQSYPNWTLYWRDDGSDDETVAIMRDFAAQVGEARCIVSPGSGRHLGASVSFLTLLAECVDAEAVAFADQDDVWLPEKLQRAAEHLMAAGPGPVLYCARQILVDAALRGTRLSVAHDRTPGFPAGLTQNIANGNTLVMNAAATALVATSGWPEGTVHDWWSYIVVSACGGRILFDPEPQVLYRLHRDNLIGSARPLPARAVAAIRRGPVTFLTMMRRHADMLATQPSRLTPQARQDLKRIQSALQGGFLRRLAALHCPGFRRRTMLENMLFRFWFLTFRPAAPAHRAAGRQNHGGLAFGAAAHAEPVETP